MALVSFDVSAAASKGESEIQQLATDNSIQTWQEGRAERIRSLESALLAVVRRKQHEQKQQQRHCSKQSSVPEPDYGSMLDSESGDNDSDDDNGHSRSSDDSRGNDTLSDSSSLFYSEGQPLLCTYQPPTSPGTNAPYTAATFSSLSSTTICVKTPEQYLPWDVRAQNGIRTLCFSVCACLTTQEGGTNDL